MKLRYVVIHGTAGWGSYDKRNEKMPYWGMRCGDLIGYLNEQGFDSCAASVSPFGSCIAERNRDWPGLKQQLIEEINALGIDGLIVNDLNLLTGAYVNLAYPLANGTAVRFLNDKDIYLGNQIERQDCERCYGVVADETFILVCEYGCNGADPQIVLYKRR